MTTFIGLKAMSAGATMLMQRASAKAGTLKEALNEAIAAGKISQMIWVSRAILSNRLNLHVTTATATAEVAMKMSLQAISLLTRPIAQCQADPARQQ